MKPFKIFLLHSTKDGDFVKKLAQQLEGEDITPWLCEVDIIPGDNFVATIENGWGGSESCFSETQSCRKYCAPRPGSTREQIRTRGCARPSRG